MFIIFLKEFELENLTIEYFIIQLRLNLRQLHHRHLRQC